MKLVTVAGPLNDFDMVVSTCIINQEFHPESAMSAIKNAHFLSPFEQSNPYAALLTRAEELTDSLGVTLAYQPFQKQRYNAAETKNYLTQLRDQYHALLDEQQALQIQTDEDARTIELLQHMRALNIPLQALFSLTYVKFRFGRLPRDVYNSFLPHLSDRKDFFLYTTSVERDWVYALYLAPRKDTTLVDSLFASLQFERLRISPRARGTSEEAIEALTLAAEQAAVRTSEIQTELFNLTRTERERFLSHYSYVRFMNDSYNIRQYAAHTQESFYLMGWVPESDYDAFYQSLTGQEDVTVIVVSDDPSEALHFAPPVKLKNAKFFKPFEPFVEMYGLPHYNESDPTPLMAITYSFLFGVMFSDFGQGLLLALLGFVLYRFKKMWLGKIIVYAGFASALAGLALGSVFGNEKILPWGFHVLASSANSFMALQLSLYAGIALLGLSILINVSNGLRQKDFLKILFGPNGLAGLVLYISLMSLILPVLGFDFQIIPVGWALACILMPVVLIFLRGPLAKLAARRKDWQPSKWSEYLLENVFELIEILLSYVTNTLSFLRVGAYTISHASMMKVVYMLAQTATGHSPVVLVIGNLFVMALEGLLVGIQVLRLDFYEVFGRFYEGGGRPYHPIIIDYTSRQED